MSDLTYAEVGRTEPTRGLPGGSTAETGLPGGSTAETGLPAGYRHVLRHQRVGSGAGALEAVATAMRAWGVQRGAGLAVRADGPPAVGVRFATGFGVGRLRLWVPCEIVWHREEPDFYGYGFGTRQGHAERGEEAFYVSRTADDDVWFDVRAFSRPATWYARLGGPAVTLLQAVVTDRYVASARRAAT